MFTPKYSISNQVLNQLSEIAEIKALVSKSLLLPEREVSLRRSAVIKMAHSSTSIEGNQLQEYQVAQIAEGEKISAEEKQIREVKNYLKALREIDNLASSKNKFNSKDILKIHRAVIDGLGEKNKTGKYRPGAVYIVNELENGSDEIVYAAPKAESVPELIEDLINWLNKSKEVHPVIRAALLHYQFETIHPFTDGNGRTGRLLTLLHLYQSGWDFKKILVLEDYYNNDRKSYYNALQTGENYKKRREADLTMWIEYFVEGFLDEAKKVKDQILTLSTIGNIPATRKILDKDELQIVDFAITVGQITSSDVSKILDIPKRTAQAKLKKLEEIRVLKKVSAGPATYYKVNKT